MGSQVCYRGSPGCLGPLGDILGCPLGDTPPPPPSKVPPILLPDSRCTPGGDGARCVCSASAVPEPSVTFDLPSRNVTVTEGHRDYTVTTPGQGTGGVVTVTGILTLRGTLDPRLAVLCSAHNPHGSVRQQLRFHHPGKSTRHPERHRHPSPSPGVTPPGTVVGRGKILAIIPTPH